MIVPDEEYLDFSKVPQSRGVPKVLLYSGLIGLLMIFAIGAATVLNSGYGHQWPPMSTTRVDLHELHE
ncbi:MAG TPA: hypothetical protein VGF86_15125 [Candidatus Tumulicola sp.]|jgi:hypothetical protein